MIVPIVVPAVIAPGRRAVAIEPIDPLTLVHEVLDPLVRVVEEAAAHDRWALVGAAACRLQGAEAASPNLEFITTHRALDTLAEMLDLDVDYGRGPRLAANRLSFMRYQVPVFVFSDPVFHGNYDTLRPLEIPSLWDARVRIEREGASVLATPLEWELLLGVVLGAAARVREVGARLRERGADGRLLTRLMREGHVQASTEEAVWAVVERGADIPADDPPDDDADTADESRPHPD